MPRPGFGLDNLPFGVARIPGVGSPDATRPAISSGLGHAPGADPTHGGGSLVGLSWSGTEPIELPTGDWCSFLEDGDTVILKAWCGGSRETPTIDFVDVSDTIVPVCTG